MNCEGILCPQFFLAKLPVSRASASEDELIGMPWAAPQPAGIQQITTFYFLHF